MMYDRAKLRELLDVAESAGLDCPADFRRAGIDDLAVYCNGIGADWMTDASRRKLTSMMSYAAAVCAEYKRALILNGAATDSHTLAEIKTAEMFLNEAILNKQIRAK